MNLRTIVSILLLSCLLGCQFDDPPSRDRSTESVAVVDSNLSEVTVPKAIGELSQSIKQYSPQVEIIAPQNGKTFDRTDIKVELKVTDLPLFQDDRLKLGNHLSFLIDNEPLPPVYDLERPIVIKNLIPGTHTLRVFATTLWGESFKNKGAYAQTTFNVLTETNSNYPDRKLPLLTYNSPTGTYGAEPILLDYYLTYPERSNRSDNNTNKLSVKATVNGTSFIIEKWQPYYLTGFEPGENWVQLELIDESENNIENTFNNIVRVFDYNPQQEDALSKLVTGRIFANEAQSIVARDNDPQPAKTPEIIDLENNAESEIVVDISDERTATIPEQLEGKQAPTTKSDRNVETIAEPLNGLEQVNNSDLRVVAPNTILETEPKLDADKELLIDSPSELAIESNKALNSEVTPTPLEPTPKKIVITEPEQQEPVVEIVIPQPESIEVTELEVSQKRDLDIPSSSRIISKKPIAIATEPEQNRSVPTETRFLWWKKFLVGLRQQIESLAKQLPNQV